MKRALDDEVTIVRESYGRALNYGDPMELFYTQFLNSSPVIGPMFDGVDMMQQKQLLRQGVNLAIMFAGGVAMGQAAMQRLGVSHSRRKLNVDPGLYPLWKTSFLSALAETDPEFSPSVRNAWESVLDNVIREMAAAY